MPLRPLPSLRFRPDLDLETVIDASHHFVGSLAYQLNRNQGPLSRLKLAVKADCFITPESLSARHLLNDANRLRELADEIDRARESLVNNTTAPLMVAE